VKVDTREEALNVTEGGLKARLFPLKVTVRGLGGASVTESVRGPETTPVCKFAMAAGTATVLLIKATWKLGMFAYLEASAPFAVKFTVNSPTEVEVMVK